MANLVSKSTLRTSVRYRADQENSSFISDSEIDYYVDRAVRALYDKLVDAFGDEYYSSSSTISVTSSTDTYALPATFYKMQAVRLLVDTNRYVRLTKATLYEIDNTYPDPSAWTVSWIPQMRCRLKYRLLGGNIVFLPFPAGSRTIKIHFAPVWAGFANDADTFDFVDGWDEYVVLCAAIKCLNKEESDPGPLLQEKMDMEMRLQNMIKNRDLGEPQRIYDAQGWTGDTFTGFEDY